MGLIETIRDAGVVGAGGAGFPTHVKVNCKAEYVIANGAECEPLLRVDQQVTARYAADVLAGLRAVMAHPGAKKGVVCLKGHYADAVGAIKKVLGEADDVVLHLMKSYYPAGDEQQIVYEVTGRVVPTGGLPLDVGAVVLNVSTLMNIAHALEGMPVTEKFVTVGGEVSAPATFCVPVGTPVHVLVQAAGGPKTLDGYILILGGPCMGTLTEDFDTPVTKTTGGVIVMKRTHPLIAKKRPNSPQDFKLAKAACCQCSFCTQLCPRNALGLNVSPAKAMRAAANGQATLLGDANGVFSCCDCGLCTYYACNFGLKPSKMMNSLKTGLGRQGVRPRKERYGAVDSGIEQKKVPVARLIARMGISRYDVPAPIQNHALAVQTVRIPLKMHTGAAAVSLVAPGNPVERGDLIADIAQGALGAKIHASITGMVIGVTNDEIEIQAGGNVL